MNFNVLFLVFGLSILLSATGTHDKCDGEPLSISLMTDKGAPLVAMLDTKIMNKEIKVYLQSLMRDMFQNYVEELIQGIFKIPLEECLTTDCFRNITIQELTDVLKDQSKEKLVNPSKNDEESYVEKSPDEESEVVDIMYELQGKCLPENHVISAKELKKDTQNILNNMVMYKEIVDMNEKVINEIKGILKLKESAGEQIVTRLLNMLKRDVKSSGVCAKTVKDCTEMQTLIPDGLSGVYTIYHDESKVKVYCDMTTDGGVWTIIQRRLDGSVNFKRNWKEYENGFGNADGEYWLGNKHIHSLTSSDRYELRIDLTDVSNTKKYAVYKTFVVGDSESRYKLTVGNYSGNAGDAMDDHNGSEFWTTGSCSRYYGPWWHSSCGDSGLNEQFSSNLKWRSSSIDDTKTSVMMIRKL